MKYTTSWDPKTYTATFTIEIDNKKYTGKAVCNPSDYDFANEKTGLNIAEQRAIIKRMKDYKNNVLLIEFRTINRLYNSVKKSHYEASAIKDFWLKKKQELDEANLAIKETEQELNSYINQKNCFYTVIRQSRTNKLKS